MFASVEGDIDATVVAVDDVIGVVGVDPNVVVVNVDIVLCNGRPVRRA